MNLQELFNDASKLDYGHSNGMTPVEIMRGPGFFPGCTGTINSTFNLEGFPIMILGQDFDTEENHANINVLKGEIETNTTWRNLKKVLVDLELDANKCFFTNAYMGLRPNNKAGSKTKNTGKSPAAKKGAEAFAEDCYTFFKIQLRTLKPELVLVLGKETVNFLCKAFKGEFNKWQNISSVKSFYENDCLSTVLRFEDRNIQFVFVIHPSLNGTNRSLIWGKEKGKTYEQDMLKKYIPADINKQI